MVFVPAKSIFNADSDELQPQLRPRASLNSIVGDTEEEDESAITEATMGNSRNSIFGNKPPDLSFSKLKVKIEPNPPNAAAAPSLVCTDNTNGNAEAEVDKNILYADDVIPGCSLFAELSLLDGPGKSGNIKQRKPETRPLMVPGPETNIISVSGYGTSDISNTENAPSSELVTINIDEFITQTDSLLRYETEATATEACSSETGIGSGYSNAAGDEPCTALLESDSADTELVGVNGISFENQLEVENHIEMDEENPEYLNNNELGSSQNNSISKIVLFEKIPRIKKEPCDNPSLFNHHSKNLGLSIEKKYKPKIGEYYICPGCRGKFVTSDCVLEHQPSCTNDPAESSSSDNDNDTNDFDPLDDFHDDDSEHLSNSDPIIASANPNCQIDTPSSSLAPRAPAVFTCSIENCSKTFKTQQTLTRHSWSHRSDSKLFTCHTCSKEFSSQFSLSRHIDREHRDRQLRQILDTPSILFQDFMPVATRLRSKSKLLASAETGSSPPSNSGSVGGGGVDGDVPAQPNKNSNDEPKETETISYNCDICDQKFMLKIFLEDHLKTHVSNDYPHSCPVCYECFQAELDLITHKGECHPHLGQDGTLQEPDVVDPLEILFESESVTRKRNSDQPPVSAVSGEESKLKNFTICAPQKTQTTTQKYKLGLTPKQSYMNYCCAKCCTVNFPTLNALTRHAVKCGREVGQYKLDHDYINWKYPCFPCQRSFPSQSDHLKHCVEFHGIRNCFVANVLRVDKKRVKKIQSLPPLKIIRANKPNRTVLADVDKLKNFPPPTPPTHPPPVPVWTRTEQTSSANNITRPINVGPPYKRNVIKHISNERLRRIDLRISFCTLRNLIPQLVKQPSSSKHTILMKAKEYIRTLKTIENSLIHTKRKLASERDSREVRLARLKLKNSMTSD